MEDQGVGVSFAHREHPPPVLNPLSLYDSDIDSDTDSDIDSSCDEDMELNSLASDNSTGWMDDFLEVDLWSVPYVEPVSFDELFEFTNNIVQQNNAEDEPPDSCIEIIDLTSDE